MAYNRKDAAERLRKRRKELNLSVNELAELLNKAPRYYRDIERGSCGMSIETLIGLSRYLDISLDYILFGNTEDEAGGESGSPIAYRLLSQYSDQRQREAVVLLKTFLELTENKS